MLKVETYLPKIMEQMNGRMDKDDSRIPMDVFKIELMRVTNLRRSASIASEIRVLRQLGYIKIDNNMIELCNNVNRPYVFTQLDKDIED